MHFRCHDGKRILLFGRTIPFSNRYSIPPVYVNHAHKLQLDLPPQINVMLLPPTENRQYIEFLFNQFIVKAVNHQIGDELSDPTYIVVQTATLQSSMWISVVETVHSQ